MKSIKLKPMTPNSFPYACAVPAVSVGVWTKTLINMLFEVLRIEVLAVVMVGVDVGLLTGVEIIAVAAAIDLGIVMSIPLEARMPFC